MLLRLTAALLAILAALLFAGGSDDAPSRSDLAELRVERQRLVQLRPAALSDGATGRSVETQAAQPSAPQAPAATPDEAAPVDVPQTAGTEEPTPDAGQASTDPGTDAPAPPPESPAQSDADVAARSDDAPLADGVPVPEPRPDTAAEPAAEPEAAPVLLYVTGSAVNLRAGPSTQNAVMGRVTRGQSVLLVERLDNGWVEIEAQGVAGTVFMSGDFLSETP